MIDHSMLRILEAGQTLFKENSQPSGLFGVLEGQVAITRQVGDSAEYFFHIGGPGLWFGEVTLFLRNPVMVTATARTPVRCLYLSLSRWDELCSKQPEYYLHFARLMAMRYAVLSDHLAMRSALPPEDYLRIRLADLAVMLQTEDHDQTVVELSLSQNDLAHMVGASRQTVNVLLKKLEAEGLVELGFRKVRILDAVKLRGERSNLPV